MVTKTYPVSRQTMEIFELLAEFGRPMSARLISRRLGVMPQTVYRAMMQLVDKGLVSECTIYGSQPKFYRAESYSRARRGYLAAAGADFEQYFAPRLSKISLAKR